METLVRDVNSHMRQRQEQERLKTIIARIDSYEPIETKDEELQVKITIAWQRISVFRNIAMFSRPTSDQTFIPPPPPPPSSSQFSGPVGDIDKPRPDLPNAGLRC